MQIFKDAGLQAGDTTPGFPVREWQIALTFSSLKRVKDALKIDLADPLGGDPPLLTRMNTDVELLCNVIYILCKPQADARNVSDEQFGALLGAEAIAGAYEALFQEWIDFFRKLGRKEVETVLQKQKTLTLRMAEKASQEMMSNRIDAAIEKRLDRGFTDFYNSLENSESIPTTARSAS